MNIRTPYYENTAIKLEDDATEENEQYESKSILWVAFLEDNDLDGDYKSEVELLCESDYSDDSE